MTTPTTNRLGWTEYRNEAGELHREDGPALIKPNGTEEWWLDGKQHRVGGPAVTNSKLVLYYQNDKLHREDGPALVAEDREEWWLNGKPHRLDGPAINGSEAIEYRVNGKLHRTKGPALIIPGVLIAYYVFDMLHRDGGPAVVYEDGREELWLAGQRVDELDI